MTDIWDDLTADHVAPNTFGALVQAIYNKLVTGPITTINNNANTALVTPLALIAGDAYLLTDNRDKQWSNPWGFDMTTWTPTLTMPTATTPLSITGTIVGTGVNQVASFNISAADSADLISGDYAAVITLGSDRVTIGKGKLTITTVI